MKLLENSNTALRSELELFRKTSLNKKVSSPIYDTPNYSSGLRWIEQDSFDKVVGTYIYIFIGTFQVFKCKPSHTI